MFSGIAVVIDALKPNPLFESDAQEILRLASEKAMNGFVGANSLTDIFYVLRKEHGADKAKMMIYSVRLIMSKNIRRKNAINIRARGANIFTPDISTHSKTD